MFIIDDDINNSIESVGITSSRYNDLNTLFKSINIFNADEFEFLNASFTKPFNVAYLTKLLDINCSALYKLSPVFIYNSLLCKILLNG